MDEMTRPKIGQGFTEVFSGGFPGVCYGADNHGNRVRRCLSVFFFFRANCGCFLTFVSFLPARTQPFNVLASHKVLLFAG